MRLIKLGDYWVNPKMLTHVSACGRDLDRSMVHFATAISIPVNAPPAEVAGEINRHWKGIE